jgi:hypothetical protein
MDAPWPIATPHATDFPSFFFVLSAETQSDATDSASRLKVQDKVSKAGVAVDLPERHVHISRNTDALLEHTPHRPLALRMTSSQNSTRPKLVNNNTP